jgi:hypothetical protein
VSPPVASGHVYVYHLRIVDGGREIDRAVRVRAGDRITLNFTGAQVRESRAPSTAPSNNADIGSIQPSYGMQPASRPKGFASQSPYGGYTWRALPFPQWNDLAIPWPQR